MLTNVNRKPARIIQIRIVKGLTPARKLEALWREQFPRQSVATYIAGHWPEVIDSSRRRYILIRYKHVAAR